MWRKVSNDKCGEAERCEKNFGQTFFNEIKIGHKQFNPKKFLFSAKMKVVS